MALIDFVLEKSGYKEFILKDKNIEAEVRWENINELKSATESYLGLGPKKDLEAFLDEVALVSEIDEMDEAQDAVTLMLRGWSSQMCLLWAWRKDYFHIHGVYLSRWRWKRSVVLLMWE